MPGRGCRDGHRVIEEGDFEFVAGLGEAEHNVAGLADLFADCAAGDFALSDEGVDVVFPAIGLEGDVRAVMNKTG